MILETTEVDQAEESGAAHEEQAADGNHLTGQAAEGQQADGNRQHDQEDEQGGEHREGHEDDQQTPEGIHAGMLLDFRDRFHQQVFHQPEQQGANQQQGDELAGPTAHALKDKVSRVHGEIRNRPGLYQPG